MRKLFEMMKHIKLKAPSALTPPHTCVNATVHQLCPRLRSNRPGHAERDNDATFPDLSSETHVFFNSGNMMGVTLSASPLNKESVLPIEAKPSRSRMSLSLGWGSGEQLLETTKGKHHFMGTRDRSSVLTGTGF